MFKSHKTSALIRAIVIAASTSLTLAACSETGSNSGRVTTPVLNTNNQATNINNSQSRASTSSTSSSPETTSVHASSLSPTSKVETSVNHSSSSNLTLNTGNTNSLGIALGSNSSKVSNTLENNGTLPSGVDNSALSKPSFPNSSNANETIPIVSQPDQTLQPTNTTSSLGTSDVNAVSVEREHLELPLTPSHDTDLTLPSNSNTIIESSTSTSPKDVEVGNSTVVNNDTVESAGVSAVEANTETTQFNNAPSLEVPPLQAQPPHEESPESSVDSAARTPRVPETNSATDLTINDSVSVKKLDSIETQSAEPVVNQGTEPEVVSHNPSHVDTPELSLPTPEHIPITAVPVTSQEVPKLEDSKLEVAVPTSVSSTPATPNETTTVTSESSTTESTHKSTATESVNKVTSPPLEPKSASELLSVNNKSLNNKVNVPAEQPPRLTIKKMDFASQVNQFTGVKEVGIENFLGKDYYAVKELQAATENALRQRVRLEHINGAAATDFTLKETIKIAHQRIDTGAVSTVTGHNVNFVKSVLNTQDAGHAVPFVASGRSLTTATTNNDGFIVDPQSPLFGLVDDQAGKVAVIDFGPQFTGANKNRIEYAFAEPDKNNKNNAPYLANVTAQAAQTFVATHGDLVLWRLQASGVNNTVPGLMRDHGKIRFLGGNQANYQGYYLDKTLDGLGKGGILDKALKDGYRIVNMSFGVAVDPIKLGDFLKSNGDNTVAHALWMQRTWGWITRKTLEGEFLSSLRQIKFTNLVDSRGGAYNQYNGRDYANTLEELTQRDVLAVNAIGNKSNAFDLLSLYLALDRERYPNAFKGTIYVTSYDASRNWTPTSCHELRDICVAAPSYLTYQYSSDTLQALNAAHFKVNSAPEVNGTSFSAPYVSSVAALVRSVFPWMSNHNLQQTILTTAKDIGDKGIDSRYGWGLIQPQDAINGPKIFQFTDRPFLADLDHNVDLNIVGKNKRFYFYNQISGGGGLEVRGGKTANNALVLANTNIYTGTTKVSNQGFLVLDGNLVTSDVTVEGNSRFQGRGLVKNLNVSGSELVAYNYPQGSELNQLVRINPNTRGANIYIREFAHEKFSYNNSLVVYNYLHLDQGSTTRIYLGQPILVGQMATLNNSTLQVDGIARMILTPGSYAYGEVLFAADGIEGTFGKVNFTSPLLTHEVLNEQEQVSFSKVDHNGNQVAGNTRVPQTYWLKVKYNGVVSSLPRITSAQDTQRDKIVVGAQNLDTITTGLARVNPQSSNGNLEITEVSSARSQGSTSEVILQPNWRQENFSHVFTQVESMVQNSQQDALNFQLLDANNQDQGSEDITADTPKVTQDNAIMQETTTTSLTLAQTDSSVNSSLSDLRLEGMANSSQPTLTSQATPSPTLASEELGNLTNLNREQLRELAVGFAGSEFVAARNHHNLITITTLRTQVDNAVTQVASLHEGLTLDATTNYAQTANLTKLQQNHFQLAYKSGDALVTLHFTKGTGSWKSEIMTQTATTSNLGIAVGYQQHIPSLGGWAGVLGTYQQVQDEFSRRWSLANTTYAFNHKLSEANYGVGLSYVDYREFVPGHRFGLYGALLGLRTELNKTQEDFGDLRNNITEQQNLSWFLAGGINYELRNLFAWGLNLNTAYGIVVAHQDNRFQNLQLQLLDNGKVTTTIANDLMFTDNLTANKVRIYHTGSVTLSKHWGAWKVGATLELNLAQELSKKLQLDVQYSF